MNKNPAVSIIIPTYNSEKTLRYCLESVKNQDYQGEVKIIIVDGGSTDNTLEITGKYTDRIYQNPLKTGEAGKAVGVKHARGEIVALIDSDNILPGQDWLSRMTAPFADVAISSQLPHLFEIRDPQIAGSKPHCITRIAESMRLSRGTARWCNHTLFIYLNNYIKKFCVRKLCLSFLIYAR